MAVSPGLYKHFKGTIVRVLHIALHSESKEEMVVYIHLEDGALWVRPLKMFEEIVKDGTSFVPRFIRIDNYA